MVMFHSLSLSLYEKESLSQIPLSKFLLTSDVPELDLMLILQPSPPKKNRSTMIQLSQSLGPLQEAQSCVNVSSSAILTKLYWQRIRGRWLWEQLIVPARIVLRISPQFYWIHPSSEHLFKIWKCKALMQTPKAGVGLKIDGLQFRIVPEEK